MVRPSSSWQGGPGAAPCCLTTRAFSGVGSGRSYTSACIVQQKQACRGCFHRSQFVSHCLFCALPCLLQPRHVYA
jgi:hypothetical protein